MKKTLFVLALLLVCFSSRANASEEGFDIIDNQIEKLNLDELEKIIQDVREENEFFPDIDTKDFLLGLIKGDINFSISDLVHFFGFVFLDEVRVALSLLAKILVITLISSILVNLQSAFENSSISNLANYIAYSLIAILVIGSFSQIMELAGESIDRMTGFMQAILPILLTLLTAVSGPNTRILFHPMILLSVNLIATLIKSIILPLIHFSFIISIISNISNRVEFSKLSELGRQVIGFIITGAFTLFIGIITIYGLGTKIDGLTIRTAKFAVDKFIPIVGRFLSDAVDAVIGCSAILKNGIGFIGLFVILFICILPVIKIAVLIFIYKIIGVVVEPIGSKNLVEFFGQVSKSLLLLLVSIISTATMFFITISIIVEAGNNFLMFR